MITDSGEEVSSNNSTSQSAQIVHHPSIGQELNEVLNNDNTGSISKTNNVGDSHMMGDFISVSNKTGSMSSLSHEKSKIAFGTTAVPSQKIHLLQ